MAKIDHDLLQEIFNGNELDVLEMDVYSETLSLRVHCEDMYLLRKLAAYKRESVERVAVTLLDLVVQNAAAELGIPSYSDDFARIRDRSDAATARIHREYMRDRAKAKKAKP
jgi:hypothetical protein